MNVTCGHSSSWNDKTIVLYDELVRSVHHSERYQDFEFQMLQKHQVVMYALYFIVEFGLYVTMGI